MAPIDAPFLKLGYAENDVELPSGAFKSRLTRLQSDIAMDTSWSLSALIQYDNAARFLGGSLRLRYRPRDEQEMLLVVNSAFDVEPGSRIVRTESEALLKLSYTLRL